MASKAESHTAPPGTPLGARSTANGPQTEFEQFRAILLDDTHADLLALREENLLLKESYIDLQAQHDKLVQSHQKLAREKETLQRQQDHLTTEQQRLQHQIDDKEAFTTRVTPIIADSLERGIAESGETMAEVVAPLMAPAIKKQIHDSRDEMVEALHPIIGQTVKRAVAEAMRRLVQQINQRLDRAFNMQGSWRRVKARLTGMPESLAVLPEVLPFSVENIFLIARKTGLLMAHVADETHTEADAKAQMVSSMLTAIQDFIKDTFGAENASDLHELRHGDGITYIIASPMLLLAADTKGQAPRDFAKLLERVLNRIQNSSYNAIVNFDGDTATMESTRPVLQKFMHSFATTPAPAAKTQNASPSFALKIVYGVAALLLVAAIVWQLRKPAPEPAIFENVESNLVANTNFFRLEARTVGEVWMRVYPDAQDSSHYQDFRFQADETYAWRANHPIRLRVGNAGETELYLNGDKLDSLGQVHRPVTLVIARAGILSKE